MPTLPEGLILQPSTPGRGRSVLAARPFSAGTTVAVFEETGPSSSPSIAIPDSSRLSETCSHCLRVSASLLNTLSAPSSSPSTALAALANSGSGSNATSTSGSTPALRGSVPKVHACTGCKVVHYCSTTCQAANWKLAHGKGECRALKRARLEVMKAGLPQVVPTPVRTLLQVLCRPAMLDALFETEGHEEEDRVAPGTKSFDMTVQVHAALEFLGQEKSQENIALGLAVTCKLQVNSFNRQDTDFGQSGIYVNAALSMVNHSCMPNAYVAFTGRKAILHAYHDIKEGEEVTISYVECDSHRSQRQHHLKTHYYFTCQCLRCKDDLDVYQVCQLYPNLELNSSDPFSLLRDVDKLRTPPVKHFLNSSKALQRKIAVMHPICTAVLDLSNATAARKQLRQRWKLCAPLREAGLYAVEPLNKVISDACIALARNDNLAYAFAVACFEALNIQPYISPAPFFGSRVKHMFMLTKLLTLGPFSASIKGTGELATKVSQYSSKVDQATMCQALLIGVIHYCPAARSDEWQLRYQAQDLLDDLKSLPGRETENALVDAFAKNPTGPEERRFFNTVVLEPIQEAASFALEILDAGLGD
ncbi:hypothetical protein F4805DRAFT_186390 [Annulohypoxylon moriforme]|nr:hypothetical protein F4805DRAFT_186390 [Annulohypoxylon moriforme]